MSAYNLVPAWRLRGIFARNKATEHGSTSPGLLQAHPIGQLPFLTRRVLRIIASNPGIKAAELDRQADLDGSARPHVDALEEIGLVKRDNALHTLTNAGMHCLAQSPAATDRALAQRAVY